MRSPFQTLIRRLNIIVLGGTARLLAALSSVAISLVVVRAQSPALWGELVPFMLILEFGFAVIGFGSLPYLVQQFSLHPERMKIAWSQSTFSRAGVLILFLILILFLPFSLLLKTFLLLWALGRFAYQCFEPIAQVNRNFIFSIFMESVAIAIVVIPTFLFPGSMSIEALVMLFAASMIWRAIVSAITFRNWISFSPPSLKFFKDTAPFFLLTLSGMLQQRTDLYCVTYFLNEGETAVYQVYFNFLIFFQFLSSLLLSPFAKNIFRMSPASLKKLELNFMLAGIPLTLAGLLAIAVMIRYLYHFELSWVMYGLGYFYMLMFYLYLLRNYELGKRYRQTTVAIYGFVASSLNAIVCIVLIPVFGMEGALLAGLSAQVLLVVLYRSTKFTPYAKG